MYYPEGCFCGKDLWGRRVGRDACFCCLLISKNEAGFLP
jgi:hypothetical protein